MAREWTKAQQSAIDTRDKTLLVSAAAGSGKTATLTERIIQSILDDENPIELSEMLIVTFTKAATGELKERISAAITAALLASPGNERLERQLHLLPSAKISTIDSFCSDILRSNCERVGVNPGYRIADEAEALLIAENIMEGLLDELFEDRLPEVATADEISALADCLTDTKSRGDLAEVIFALHASTTELVEGVGRVRALVEEYNTENICGIESTTLGKHSMRAAHEMAEHYIKVFSEHIERNAAYGTEVANCGKRIEVLRRDIAYLERIVGTESYTEMFSLLREASFESTPQTSKQHAPYLPPTKDQRAALKAAIARLNNELFGYNEADWLAAYDRLYPTLMVLVRVLEEFDRLFTAHKLRLGLCEFSDVSRYTHRCLWQDGERTDIALAEAEKYRAIYVDEYQDVNAIQHEIFVAISTPTNRFMVGDIKQSIYGFRGADCGIFAELKSAYPTLGEEGEGDAASIFMSDNFRCDEGIIDFSNSIFDRIFGVLRKKIGYVEEDRLRFSKKYDGTTPPYRAPEVCMLPKGMAKKTMENEDGAEYSLEPLVVAEKIQELINTGTLNSGEPIRPGDIAIIIRKNKGRDKDFAAALASLEIPCAIADTADFFLNSEILLIMSILNTIDNPNRDIYLASTLMSPMFRFTADDMTAITRERKDTLYRSLLAYNEANPDFEPGARFVEWLSRYRTYADGTAVDVLIKDIYRDTGIMSYTSDDGRECLNRFYEYARRFEASSFRGLYNFINYINQIVDRKNPFDKRDANLDPNSVKIITAHASKGLEFPVVFFVGLGSPFKFSSTERIVYDNRCGIGIDLRTENGLGFIKNPTKPILLDMKLRHEIEEEARVLYVILTRARERLFVVGTPSKMIDNMLSDRDMATESFDEYVVYSLKNFGEMIAFPSGVKLLSVEEFIPNISKGLREALYPPKEASAPPEEEGAPLSDEFASLGQDDGEAAPVLTFEDIDCDFELKGEAEIPEKSALYDRLSDTILGRFTFEYKDEHMTRMPKKLSVSRLYPEILDGANEGVTSLEDAEEQLQHANMERLPVFATGTDATESAKRGISTHLLFQFCDFERLRDLGAEAELSRLTEERYLSIKDAERVRVAEVEAFRRSELFRELLGARRLYRELRFNTRLAADLFTANDELSQKLGEHTILVQGVIDCLYEDESGELHLVDYKTDRLTWEERKNPALAEERLRRSHSLQLSYYSKAVELMFGRAPISVEVYSLHLGRCVSVKE